MFSYKLAALVLARLAGGAKADGFEASDHCALQTALTCEGGGYRAMSACTGLTAGFLAGLGNPSEGLGLLFEDVDLVAANSGGTWFAVPTLYSHALPEMMEQMAASPSEAYNIYNTQWTDRTLGVARRRLQGAIIPDLNARLCPLLVEGYNGVPFDEVIFGDFINGPTSIPDTATLSMKPNNSWAEGKVVLLCSSLPIPGSGGDDARAWVHFTTNSTGDINGSISYRARRSPDNTTFPAWAPVKFTFRLGDAADAAAPFPFCANEDCNGLFLEYIGFSGESGENYTAFSPGLGEILNPFLVEGAGSLPLSKVVPASNSDAGSAVITNAVGDDGGYPSDPLESSACPDLATWVTNGSFEYPFSAEDSQITEELIQETAATAPQGLVDGGWSDNTGVANTLGIFTSATGCAEPRNLSITAVVTGKEVPFYFLDLFQGTSTTLGPVCSSPGYWEVKEQMRSSAALLPTSDAGYLTNISYGTINCETVENIWYGVKGGFQVDIHFLWIVTPLGTSPPLSDFYAMANLSSEIVQTMAYESAAVKQLAGTLFLLNTTEGSGTSSAPDAATSASGTSAEPSAASTTDGDASSAFELLFPCRGLALTLSLALVLLGCL